MGFHHFVILISVFYNFQSAIGAVHADVNESGCGHVMESNDIFSTDRPWYNIKKYQRILLANEWFSSKKLSKMPKNPVFTINFLNS
jgi:hypothetical protein